MKKLHPLLRFFIVATLCYIFGLVIWPSLRSSYAEAFNKNGDLFFGDFGVQGVVRFTSKDPEKSITQINLGKRGNVQISLYEAQTIQPKYASYLYFVLLLSLIIASPVNWKQKGIAVGIGIICLQLFVWLKLLLVIYARYNNPDVPYGIYHLSSGITLMLNTTVDYLVVKMGPSLIFTVILWIVLTFRKADMVNLRPLIQGFIPKQKAN